jgi:hypothetical protein
MWGDSEDVRVVFSKLEEIGERAFAGEGACARALLPPTPPSHATAR